MHEREQVLPPQAHPGDLGGKHGLPTDEVRRERRVEAERGAHDIAQRQRHIGYLHESELQDDLVEALPQIVDGGP